MPSSSCNPPAVIRRKREPTRSPCSAECVIHTSAFSFPLPPFTSSSRYFSTVSDAAASSADVGSENHHRQREYEHPVSRDVPSKRRISALPSPTAVASAIRCASPPLRLPQLRSQSSSSMPHAFATSNGFCRSGCGEGGVSPSLCPCSSLSLSSFLRRPKLKKLESLEGRLREPKAETVLRKSRGVPGSRDGRWGT